MAEYRFDDLTSCKTDLQAFVTEGYDTEERMKAVPYSRSSETEILLHG